MNAPQLPPPLQATPPAAVPGHLHLHPVPLAGPVALWAHDAHDAAGQARLATERRVLHRLHGLPGVPAVQDEVPATAALLIPGPAPLARLWLNLPADLQPLTGTPSDTPSDPSPGTVASDLPAPAGRLLPAPLPLPQLLGCSLDLARILAAVHRRGVQHRHLHPGQLLWPAGTPWPASAAELLDEQRPPALALIGFDQASTAAEEHPGFIHHRLIQGTLAWCAPEQTGRSGQAVDARADLYSLGATLFALATGRPPFLGEDPLTLIHQHLAARPTSPARLRPDLPPEFAAVILKLLEKSPDHRYQSAEGLALDLAELATRWQQPEAPAADFVPGLLDHPERLSAPTRLVGRELETEALAFALERASDSVDRTVLVAGVPGVGKTALVNTLRPAVTARQGWFVSGKFDPLRQDQDADAMRQALRALGRLLLAEPEGQLARDRQALRQALGPNAPLVAAHLPEFALLLDLPAHAPSGFDAGITETRLTQAAIDLLRTVVHPGRPLVMVIDDLQWGSSGGLRLFDALVCEPRLRGLMLVGAYRANEVDAAHPLTARLDRWSQRVTPPRHLPLANLPQADLGEFLARMLRLAPAPARQLADLLLPRTDGNPFDSVELINAWRRERLLKPTRSGWTWDAPALARQQLAAAAAGTGADVIPLLQQRMGALPERTQLLLSVLACLGGEVPAPLLAAGAGLDTEALERDISPALDDGLVLRADEGEPLLRFRHDRVAQAALARLGGPTARLLQLQIARRVSAHGGFDGVAAEQYLAAAALLNEPAEQARAAQLFAAAAARLRLINTAHTARLCAAGLALLGAGPRPGQASSAGPVAVPALSALSAQDSPLRQSLAAEHHLALYNLGQLAEADAAYAQLHALHGLPHAAEPAPAGAPVNAPGATADAPALAAHLALVPATCLQISALTHRGRARDAVDLGLATLAALGTRPPRPLAEAVEQGLSDLVRETERRSPPPGLTRDPRTLAVAQLLDRLVIPSLQCDPPVNAWLAIESHRLWTTQGSSPALVRAVALCVPLVLAGRRGAYHAAWTVARQALDAGQALLDAGGSGYEVATATARHVYAIATQHWAGPVEASVAQARQAHDALLRGGDLQFACLTFNATLPALLDSAPALARTAEEAAAGLAFAQRSGNAFAQAMYTLYARFAEVLATAPEPTGRGIGSSGSHAGATTSASTSTAASAPPPGSFDGPGFSETSRLSGPGSVGTPGAIFRILRALSAAIFDDLPGLDEHARAALPLLPAMPGFHPTAWARALHGLALARTLQSGAGPMSRESTDEMHRQLQAQVDWLSERATDQAANYAHLHLWLRAEQAHARGNLAQALAIFDAALRALDGHARPWARALITERAGRLHLDSGLQTTGQALLAQALAAWDTWGAHAKVARLRRQWRFLPAAASSAAMAPATATPPSTATPTSDTPSVAPPEATPAPASVDTGPAAPPAGHDDPLDLMAVLRASRLLSSETKLPRLVARVSELMAAMTGADQVQLLLRGDAGQGWQLVGQQHAHAHADTETTTGTATSTTTGTDAAPAGRAHTAPDLVVTTTSLPLDTAARDAGLPLSAFRYAERTLEPLLVQDACSDDRFAQDPALAGLARCSLLVLPILHQGQPRAMLVLHNRLVAGAFQAARLDALQLVASQLAVSLENAQLYGELEARVEQRTAELRDTQAQLLDAARRAGMAEIATNVLHNVGNVLNSVNVSAELVSSRLRQSRSSGFAKAVALLSEHESDLPAFFMLDERGRRLPGYLRRLVDSVAAEQGEMQAELQQLSTRVQHIKEIVATQQSYAGQGSVRQRIPVAALVQDALQMTEASMARHQVRVDTRVPADLPPLPLDRPRLMQILVNLLANAKQACNGPGQPEGRIVLEAALSGQGAQARLRITVQDNGCGIPAENLERVFAHGFTTRPDGHGFGLHSSVLAAQDMGGKLVATSPGPGQGATFTLDLPVGGSLGV